MKKFLLLGLMLTATSTMFAQGAKNIKINEVLTNNTASYQDEYGEHHAWVELVNNSYTTYNVRNMFITTDRAVLNPDMTVPERMKLMSVIPSGDSRTTLSAQQHLLLFCNSNPYRGSLHLAVRVNADEPTWIALYDGNATVLIDSVTVPVLEANQSFARASDGAKEWKVRPADAATPGISNFIQVDETKVARIKRTDPHGFGLTLLSMGIVFSCLALLFIFFWAFGRLATYMKERNYRVERYQTLTKLRKASKKAANYAKDGLTTKGIDKEIYMAVIAMAIKEYAEDVHDMESNVITIKPKTTGWNDKASQITHFHEN